MMHQSDREQLWIQIDRIRAKLHDLQLQQENPICTCEKHECDDCAVGRWVEEDIRALESQHRELLAKLPEVKYADET